MWSCALLVWWLAASVCGRAQNDGDQFFFPDDEILQTSGNKPPTPRTTVGPKIKPQSPQPLTTSPSQSSGKSFQMCRKYAEAVYLKVESLEGETFSIDTCSLVEPLIVNGTITQPREFPHMALIGFASTVGIQWKCGGSLISERFVLSAAHCNPRNPKRVRLGDYNIRSTEDDENNDARSVEFSIIQVIEHPEYNEAKGRNDITLYKLDRTVVFSEYMRPICLHTEYELPRRFGIVSGWGSTDYGAPSSAILLKGNVSFVSAKECSDAWNSGPETIQGRVSDDMMICAANFLNGTDTCQGDSGGPLQYRLSDPYCMYSQVGITSFGVKCGFEEGQKKYPAIYTRVSKYVPWIESIVWP